MCAISSPRRVRFLTASIKPHLYIRPHFHAKDRKFLRVRASRCPRLRLFRVGERVLLAMIDPGRGCEPGTQAALWQIKKRQQPARARPDSQDVPTNRYGISLNQITCLPENEVGLFRN